MARCALCNRRIETGQTAHCRCGKTLHAGCQSDHAHHCPLTSDEGWIDAEEF